MFGGAQQATITAFRRARFRFHFVPDVVWKHIVALAQGRLRSGTPPLPEAG